MRSTPEGRQTTDPNVALDGGTVQPIGGPKGSALAMLMDVMGGVISGAAFGGDVRNHFEEYDQPQNVGHFIMAMKPDLFVSRDEYSKRMDTLVQRVHACPTAEGFDEVIMPGERERRLEAKYRRTGVPFNAKEVADAAGGRGQGRAAAAGSLQHTADVKHSVSASCRSKALRMDMPRNIKTLIVVPENNTTMEPEISALCPTLAPIPVARVKRPARTLLLEDLPAYAEATLDAIAPFADRQFDLVIYGCTAAGFLGGPDGNARMVDKLRQRTGASVVSTAGAMIDALQSAGVSETAVVTPYLQPVNDGLRRYL